MQGECEFRALPAAVVARCVDAYGDRYRKLIWSPDVSVCVAAALAEFLAILEERGLRIVPEHATDEMRESCAPILRGDEAEVLWQTMYGAAPPLAELLE